MITLKKTKNGESQIILMSPMVRKAIHSLKKHPKSDLLFPGSDPSKPWDFRKPFAKALQEAKLDEPGKEKFVFHHLRHTFCSQLALTGSVIWQPSCRFQATKATGWFCVYQVEP